MTSVPECGRPAEAGQRVEAFSVSASTTPDLDPPIPPILDCQPPMSLSWTIDADIRRAATLPAEVYSDPRWFAAARDRVFARSWQLVADTDAVRVPGATYPFTLLDGILDEPLLLTRDSGDQVHCLSNVCTHRGT